MEYNSGASATQMKKKSISFWGLGVLFDHSLAVFDQDVAPLPDLSDYGLDV
jgi:hypothetical protein